MFDKKQNEFVQGVGAEHPTSCIEDKLAKGYPDALLATSIELTVSGFQWNLYECTERSR